MSQPVTLINVFTLPLDQADRFLDRWKVNAQFMADADGFVRARMYRELSQKPEISFVNVGEWASGAAFDQARRNPDWVASVRSLMEDPEFTITARPLVYELTVDVAPGDQLH